MRPTTEEQQKLLHQLIDNGFDFLDRSISDFEEAPKYSVINFHAAIEILIKARLMAEHWSLIVSKKQDLDWEKFVAGDFISVSMEEADKKLKKAVMSGLKEREIKIFRDVKNHRNKMIHFFHEAHSSGQGRLLRQKIAKEQLTAWYLLHKILTERWGDIFNQWSEKIEQIDNKLKKLQPYLEVIFSNIQPKIRDYQKRGYAFCRCYSCGLEAQPHEYHLDEVYTTECLVCGLTENCIQVRCPNCEGYVFFLGDVEATCPACNNVLDQSDLGDILIDQGAAHAAAMDGDQSYDPGNCGFCDGYQTIIHTKKGQYVCISCLNTFESLEFCGWCNEPNSGNMEDSYIAGCNHCDGYAGHHKDD